ncbi:hypothetical protein AB1Y20_000864 [Prymnesium parvum]|uniref:Neuroblastoma-amplified sequence n=1 Tax=Prymnesium parvum TaxID=97485 RepID=A0AB34KAY6_PRYPA
MAEQLLYEVVLHGVGWRLEQEESADMVLGWRTRRELHEGDDVDDDAPRSAIEENSAGQIVTALQQRDARALLRHLLPHRLVALSLWLLRDGATILAQLEGRRAGLVHALERRHAQLPEWQLALCHGGEILAIWRTEELVVLSSRDNFASPVALWAAPADSKPHCRLLAWSPDDSLLAAATSDGTVHVLDARARLLHRLPPTSWGLPAAHGSLSGAEVGHAITGMAFRSSRQREGGDAALLWELLLLSCDAVLHRISIPSAAATTVHGTTPSRSTSPPVLLGAHHGMVSCMSYDQNHGLLAVGGGGGCASLQASLLRAKQDPASPPLALPSLSIWALRDRPPFSSLIFTTTTNASSAVPVAAAMRRLWMRAHAVLRGTGVPSAVSFCPSGERLSVLTLEGQLTVWDTEPLVTASRAEGTLSSGMPELPLVLSEGEPLDKCIICTGWWDDSSIILATRLGAVSICRLPQLQNLLGAPHPFAAGSALSTAQNNSLFVLEREIQPIAEQERATAATTHPQRRVQSWRLISLRQTSPEVLFERKVALREYEAALQWAHLYGMSEDPVRQAQWRESEVTAASINSYLAKVTSLRWVLDECCHRVPPDPHDLELLLNFGRDRAKATLRSTGEGSAAPQEHDLSRVEIEEFILRLARYSTRLKTSLRLSEAEGRTGFDVEAFVMLRDVAMSDFAHEMAAQERFSTLEVLIKSHKEELDHLRLDLLRSVPETTPPSNYAFLIAPIAAEALQAHSGAAAGSRSIDAASLCEWFCLRAREIDERSGALDNAEELLQLAVSLGLGAHVRQMLATVQLLSSLVYRLDCTASLAEFESFSEQQRIALLFSLAPPWAGERADHAFHDFCRQHVKPFLRLQRRGPRLLREYAIRLAVEDSPHALHLCAALVHLSGHERPVEERLLRPQSLLIDTALRCIYGSPRADDEALELMTAMYKALPGRDVALSTAEDESDEEEADEENSEAREHEESSSAPGHSQLPLLLDQLDALQQHLSAQYELRDYGMLQRMSDYLQGERGLDAERGHKLLRAMARHTGRRSPPASSGVWLQTRDDMVQLRDQACSQLPSELAYCEWLQALLLAAEFRLAADFLRAQTSSTPLLGMDTAERLVLMAAREYFNSAPSSADSSVEHAEKCLRVLPLASGEVEAELNLVKAVRLLATFGCELLPLQVRMHPDRRKLVVELVRSCSAATARLADFEQLAEALGLKSGSDRAAIAEAVAWKALDEGDQRCAVQLALQLVSERHGSSWSLCDVLLARCGDARSASSPGGGAPSGERADGTLEPRTRQKLLSHALAHCDPDRFEPLMQLWRDWRDEQTTASLRAQADSLSMHSSEESMAAMKSVAALHQDYQTLHEIKKAISDGLTFREWMQLNESADVTADGFTERVNRNDFRARYWAEAGGVFSPSEQRHLSSTRAADPPADDPERVRMRHMFNRSPVAAQASQIEETEATLKAVIGCVTGEEQSENMDATLEPAAARRALLRSRLLLIEAQPRPCSDAVKQVERSIRIELFRGCLRGKLAALSQAAADGNFDAFEEPSEGSISADENAMNRQAIIDLSLESEPEIALALSSQMWDESTVELTVTTLWRRIRAAAGTGGVDSVRSISEMGAWACARMAIVLRDPSKEAAERLRRAESLAELLPMVIRDGKSREGIAGLLHSHLDGFLEVLRELETAERLAATLPEIDCAQFATDRSARTRTCVELACTQVDGALQDALEIARRVGMDEWELRMACVRAALVERNEGGAPADLSEWRSRLRDTLAQHDQHLLQYPTRLSRALVLDVLPAVAAQPVPMDAVMQLMLEGENKQRADQKVSVARSAVSPTLLNHNLLLLLSTRAVFRYLRKAAASIDPRDLLRLGLYA